MASSEVVVEVIGRSAQRALEAYGDGIRAALRWRQEMLGHRSTIASHIPSDAFDWLIDPTWEPEATSAPGPLRYAALVRDFILVNDTPEIGVAAARLLRPNFEAEALRHRAMREALGVVGLRVDELARRAPVADVVNVEAALTTIASFGIETDAGHADVRSIMERLRAGRSRPDPGRPDRAVPVARMLYVASTRLGEMRPMVPARLPPGAADASDPSIPVTYVNVGVAMPDAPDTRIEVAPRLSVVQVWVELGPRSADAVPGNPEPVNAELLEAGETIEVVLFADRGLEVSPDRASGKVRMEPGSSFPVVVPALDVGRAPGLHPERRLYFAVRTPDSDGVWRVRCALFVRGVLIHVEQLTLAVGDVAGRIETDTAFRLVRDFSSDAAFATLEAPTAVVYANDGEGTHDFCFFLPGSSTSDFRKPAHLDAPELERMIQSARDALGAAAWTVESDGLAPRHVRQTDGTFTTVELLESQLVALAIAGQRLWLAFAKSLEEDTLFILGLREALARPGTLQLAMKRKSTDVAPLQLLYDKVLASVPSERLSICAGTKGWLDGATDVLPCLAEPCVDAADDLKVCAAGFWGFRHGISTTLSTLDPCRAALEATVVCASKPTALVAVTNDERVEPYWQAHRTQLAALLEMGEPAQSAGAVFTALERHPSIAYFLAHVTYDTDEVPRLEFEDPPQEWVDATAILNKVVQLCPSRTLVVLNACESAGLRPDRLLSLVEQFFLQGASGLVGTEITVFADFATVFAERFLAWYATGKPLAESLRHARLEALRMRNPLGLAYNCFGLYNLHLAPTASV